MKYDAHMKITKAALLKLEGQCARSPVYCQAPLFRIYPTIWVVDTQRSTFMDQAVRGSVGIMTTVIQKSVGWAGPVHRLFRTLFETGLDEAVALVDLNEYWTQEADAGQRYHFMRARGEKNYEAWANGVEFIRDRTTRWIRKATTAVARKVNPLTQCSHYETLEYQTELALALHALQDSFSTGHTVRSGAGAANGAPPIRELFCYALQDHAHHGDEDYTAGGLQSSTGRMAVDATAELIMMGVNAIMQMGQSLTGWDKFVGTWLAENIDRTKEVETVRPGYGRGGGTQAYPPVARAPVTPAWGRGGGRVP